MKILTIFGISSALLALFAALQGAGDSHNSGSHDGESHDRTAKDVLPEATPITVEASQGDCAAAAGWGDLKGRFILNDAPKAAKITVTQDVAFCGKFNLVDDTIQVSEAGGLSNVVIFLLPEKGQDPPTPHESYAASAEAEVVLDNKHCRFEPRVLPIRTSQKFKTTNSDIVSHNTKIDYDPDPINPNIPPGQSINHAFPQEQRLPVKVSCSSHSWMQAWLVVRDSPYMAVTDKDGHFEMANLPAGDWTFQFWHEGLGYIRKVNIGGKAAEWPRGRSEVTIDADGTTDLGEVKLQLADYPRD
jgi:hypothetical protein